MDPTEQRLEEVARAVSDWSRSRRADLSLRAYAGELARHARMAGVESFGQVLEVGCGSGLFLLSAVALGYADSALGVDPAIASNGTRRDELEATRRMAEKLGLADRLEFRFETFEQLLGGEPAGRYDALVFRNCLHHIYPCRADPAADRAEADRCAADLGEARRLLREGGRLLILEGAARGALHGALYNRGRRLKGSPPIRWAEKRTREQWMSILGRAGYRDARSETLPITRLSATVPGCLVGRMLSASFLITANQGAIRP